MSINTDGLFPGGLAWANFGTFHRPNVREGKITNRSPTGTIIVEFGTSLQKFNKHGVEPGGKTFPSDAKPHLISRDDFERLSIKQAEQRRVRHAQVCIAKVEEIPVNHANRDKLREALQAAIAAVDAL